MSVSRGRRGLYTFRLRAVLSAVVLTASAVTAVALEPSSAVAASGSSCGANINPIVCENSLPGSPKDDWFVGGTYGDIAGYGTAASVASGGSLPFKVLTSAASYEIDIYRLGWYQGNGARKIATVLPSVHQPQAQPNCLTDASSGLVDCGNWAVSATWQVPSTAVSGMYIANFSRTDGTPGENQFPFIVRNDASTADIVVQASDETWQAYNTYGTNDLYVGGFTGSVDGRAYKVSYNRPYLNSGTANFYNAEYPAIRWLERNGYDVTYVSGTDVSTNGAMLLNHKVFVSSGHDEYWNDSQRANVENARSHGVNLAFLSGNEVYWRTRLANSIDGSNTPNRTLVCYKTTQNQANLDPTQPGTGTWADPVYSIGKPQNALTGTEYVVNGGRNDALTVPAQFAKLRFWRNTSVAQLQAGQVATFADGTLGFEWDADPNTPSRPAGAIDMSSTTITIPDSAEQVLQPNGFTYAGGTVTHSLVLYRDPVSGALVFGAGTVQWSWGLDPEHLFPGPAADVRIQQATVNFLADMGAQPTTLQSGLVQATQSTDLTGPTVTVTSPAANQTVAAGSAVTVSGTATDVGGVVARVEVSIDGGTTWTPASGTSTWSYTWAPTTIGAATIKVRASDDSANIGTVVSRSVTVGAQQCPCTIFGAGTPSTADSGDTASVELGTKFVSSVNGSVTGIRFYKSAANTGTHTGSLWNSAGALLATGTFTNETASGWQTMTLTSPVAVAANQVYTVGYLAPKGHYAADANYFTSSGAGIPPLVAPQDGSSSGSNGVYSYTAGFPTSSFQGSNYWVDPIFSTTLTDNQPPSVTSVSPANAATDVPSTSSVTANFSEAVTPSSVQFTLTGPGGTAVAGAVVTSADNTSATFTPTAALAASTTYSASVKASDAFGNAMPSAVTWTFTTAASGGGGGGACPCTLFGSQAPAIPDSGEAAALELGVQFSSSTAAFVTGVRFYKSAANIGTHTGSLWTTAGAQLATGTFSGESVSGWQTLNFSSPVAIKAGTTYVVSYSTTTGHYAYTPGFFSSTPYSSGPLTAPAAANGLYKYGSGFPTSTYNGANYWVDPVVTTTGADTTPPSVTSVSPTAGATGVGLSGTVTATFSEPVDISTVVFGLTAGGQPVPGTVSLSSDGLTATFTSAASLSSSTTYSASVTASDLSGNAMSSAQTWSFTTTSATSTCPCTIFRAADAPTSLDPETSKLELGVRWMSNVDGWVTGVSFYKATSNTGTHTGSLWSNTGALLATGTFSGETASGWQTLTFTSPVAVSANTPYVASYVAPAGHYSYSASYFATSGHTNGPLTALQDGGSAGANGVYLYGGGFPTSSFKSTNYGVDVVFTTTQPGAQGAALVRAGSLSGTLSASVSAAEKAQTTSFPTTPELPSTKAAAAAAPSPPTKALVTLPKHGRSVFKADLRPGKH
jgi:hypothetical protein